MEYLKSKPFNFNLKIYIDDYNLITWENGLINSKYIQPRPGATLIFSDSNLKIGNEKFSKNILVGTQDNAVRIETSSKKIQIFVVHFSVFGLSRFINFSPVELHNQIIDVAGIFGKNIRRINDKLFTLSLFQEKINLLEKFLLNEIKEPKTTDRFIFSLSHQLIISHEFPSFKIIRSNIPMSTRNLERRFKELTGISILKFVRISRFQNAKNLLLTKKNFKLTEIGYNTGYFDQAHFSKEFKSFSGLSPKDFIKESPFYKILSKHNISN